MRIYLILLLSCFCLVTKAQTADETAIINTIFSQYIDSSAICSANAKWDVKEVSAQLNNNDNSTLGLSDDEKKELLQKLSLSSATETWKEKYLGIMRVVKSDSLESMAKEPIKNGKSSHIFFRSIFTFSKPIFIRNGTVCLTDATLSRHSDFVGTYGNHLNFYTREISIYVKVDGKWVKKIRLYKVIT